MKNVSFPSPHERSDHLREARNLKMTRSAHAYVRGSTEKFYEWLGTSEATVPVGPPVWICGDCHLGNLGPVADARGNVAVQIRDLDQTVIGNPAHDLIRLGLSLASVARGSDLPGLTTVRILEHLVSGYERGLDGSASKGGASEWAPKTVRRLLDQSTQRSWRHLAAERLATARPMVPLGKRFWAITADERHAIEELFASPEMHRTVTTLQGKEDAARVSVVDMAYWMKGCSSLGRLRYAVMLEVGEGKDTSLCLVDIKEAVGTSAPRAPGEPMPRDDAVRVVTGARALSPHLGDRMAAARLLDKTVVVRELMPQDLKLQVDALTQEEAMALSSYLGGVVGTAHARQLTREELAEWRGTLGISQPSTIDPPSWLWSSVVDLIAIHEAAYLDHCRQYACREAALA